MSDETVQVLGEFVRLVGQGSGEDGDKLFAMARPLDRDVPERHVIISNFVMPENSDSAETLLVHEDHLDDIHRRGYLTFIPSSHRRGVFTLTEVGAQVGRAQTEG